MGEKITIQNSPVDWLVKSYLLGIVSHTVIVSGLLEILPIIGIPETYWQSSRMG
jgi:hypothetical protein